ncbi:MAG TPA: DUF2785 domain-containing protein [Vitreimonas sp.]|nr:DUF2785 domain-containing protein [Vitreimonas sp.]
MRYAIFAALLLGACATVPAAAQTQCLPAAGFSRAELDALKAAEWQLPDEARRNALARALTACLGDPDPTLRDGIAFEAYAHWLRGRQLSNETMLWLADDLQARLTAPEGAGFERPFAALVLSEVARADRIDAYLTPERRAQLVDAAVAYFSSVRDYRGFDEREGWRHGVAHGADVLLQLALNPALGRPELTQLRDAIATQLAPEGHFYTYGESERMMRPIIFIAQRGVFTPEEWQEWLVRETAVSADAFTSQAGLSRRHNMMVFLSLLYMQANLSANEADNALLPGATAALRALP